MKINSSRNKRSCPVCGSSKSVKFADENIDAEKFNDFTYASRKKPEYMCFYLERCCECNLIYVLAPPNKDYLKHAYTKASFASKEEADCASRIYAKALTSVVSDMMPKYAAVDVGTGNGSLLPWLKKFGFNPIIGIEPSAEAINAAQPSVKSLIRAGMFSPEILYGTRISLICSFMTLEHLDDPLAFAIKAYDLLEPGGKIALVVHNWQGLINKILKLKSPIIDIEHLQLFNPSSIRILLKRAGFDNVTTRNICNFYPLKYWINLLPLSETIKKSLMRILNLMKLSNVKVPLYVGNIFVVGCKSSLNLVRV